MRDPCKSLKDCFEHIVKQFLYFLAKSFINAFTGLMFLALIFYIISFISPEWYRWPSRWANQPLLPIANTCNIMETNTPSNISNMKIYEIVISFDSVLERSQQVLLYDPTGNMKVWKNGKESESQTYQFMNGSGNKQIIFKALAENEALLLGEQEYKYETCPFKIQHIGG